MNDKQIWQSFVWYDSKLYLVSTIEREFETYEGVVTGLETLVFRCDPQTRLRHPGMIFQAGGLNDHQEICRKIIASGEEWIR